MRVEVARHFIASRTLARYLPVKRLAVIDIETPPGAARPDFPLLPPPIEVEPSASAHAIGYFVTFGEMPHVTLRRIIHSVAFKFIISFFEMTES